MANEEARFRPRFDQAAILQFEVGLDGGSHTDAMLPARAANRGNTVPGAKDPAFNQLADIGGDAGVERFDPASGNSRSNHPNTMSYRTWRRQTVPA